MVFFRNENGQGILETTILLLLIIFIFFALTKFLLNTTQKIVAEVQLLDLLEDGSIKWNDKFITHWVNRGHRVDGSCKINEEDIDVKVTIGKFAITEEEENKEKAGLFNETISRDETFQR